MVAFNLHMKTLSIELGPVNQFFMMGLSIFLINFSPFSFHSVSHLFPINVLRMFAVLPCFVIRFSSFCSAIDLNQHCLSAASFFSRIASLRHRSSAASSLTSVAFRSHRFPAASLFSGIRQNLFFYVLSVQISFYSAHAPLGRCIKFCMCLEHHVVVLCRRLANVLYVQDFVVPSLLSKEPALLLHITGFRVSHSWLHFSRSSFWQLVLHLIRLDRGAICNLVEKSMWVWCILQNWRLLNCFSKRFFDNFACIHASFGCLIITN